MIFHQQKYTSAKLNFSFRETWRKRRGDFCIICIDYEEKMEKISMRIVWMRMNSVRKNPSNHWVYSENCCFKRTRYDGFLTKENLWANDTWKKGDKGGLLTILHKSRIIYSEVCFRFRTYLGKFVIFPEKDKL